MGEGGQSGRAIGVLRWVFTRKANTLDVMAVAMGAHLFITGHWIGAIACVVGLSIVSVIGEHALGTNP